METKIMELIDVIKNSYTTNNIVLACTIISSLISVASLIISIIILFLQIKDRLLRKRVMGYVYQFYAPTYIVTQLPCTKQIEEELKNLIFTEKDIFNTIIELNKENIISAVGDTNTDLINLKWKPNTNYYTKKQ